jgi:hypothetical protein
MSGDEVASCVNSKLYVISVLSSSISGMVVVVVGVDLHLGGLINVRSFLPTLNECIKRLNIVL